MEGSASTRKTKALGPEATAYHFLAKAGLPDKAIAGWQESRPRFSDKLKRDAAAAQAYWSSGAALLAKLPKKSKRNVDQQAAAGAILGACRDVREGFLGKHADAIYRKLTSDRILATDYMGATLDFEGVIHIVAWNHEQLRDGSPRGMNMLFGDGHVEWNDMATAKKRIANSALRK